MSVSTGSKNCCLNIPHLHPDVGTSTTAKLLVSPCPYSMHTSLCSILHCVFPLISFYSKFPVLLSISFGLYFPILWQCTEEVKVIHLELETNKKLRKIVNLLFQIVMGGGEQVPLELESPASDNKSKPLKLVPKHLGLSYLTEKNEIKK